ncbi:MAG: T9SS type A sorting domain-containing protein [Bacteroidia bacterium]
MRSFTPFHLAAFSFLLCLFSFSDARGERSAPEKASLIVLSQHFGLNNKVFLSWEATLGERPNYWVVERAKIDGDFRAISRLNVDDPLVFVDNAPWPSARYRVKAVWKNGKQTVSNYVAWRSVSLYFPLEVSAQSDVDELVFAFPETTEDMFFSIYDANGKHVSQKIIDPRSTHLVLETQAFSEGVYILEVQYEGEAYRTRWRKY